MRSFYVAISLCCTSALLPCFSLVAPLQCVLNSGAARADCWVVTAFVFHPVWEEIGRMGARQTAAGYRYRNSAGGWLEKLAF